MYMFRQSTKVSQPLNCYGCYSSSLQVRLDNTYVSKSYSQASVHECWRQVMQDELQALHDTRT